MIIKIFEVFETLFVFGFFYWLSLMVSYFLVYEIIFVFKNIKIMCINNSRLRMNKLLIDDLHSILSGSGRTAC